MMIFFFLVDFLFFSKAALFLHYGKSVLFRGTVVPQVAFQAAAVCGGVLLSYVLQELVQ